MTKLPFPLKSRRRPIAQRQLELRTKLWPWVTPDYLWTRQTHDGFTTMPKAMPLMMSIMDDLANGQPVSSTYLELWCRAYDECFVTLSKPRELAFHSGFYGQRAERTWKARLQILAKLEFISLAEGPSGPASYALILNPYKTIQYHFNKRTPGIRADKYNALLERSTEIGDESLSPPPPPAAPPIAPAATVAAVAAPTVFGPPPPIVPAPPPLPLRERLAAVGDEGDD